MIGHLKVAFSSLVEESDWMDEETKVRALEKARAMKEYVGYPDWILNRTTLESAYSGVRHIDLYNAFISYFYLKFIANTF